MATYVCAHCKLLEPQDETHNNENYLTFTDDEHFVAGTLCSHCGRTGLKCFHSSSHFDKDQQALVCSCCGEIHHQESFTQLRAFAKQGLIPELQQIVDCTDH